MMVRRTNRDARFTPKNAGSLKKGIPKLDTTKNELVMSLYLGKFKKKTTPECEKSSETGI